jgi:kynurenine formamidase
MKIIDLTHPLSSSTPVFPGDPSISLSQSAFISKDTYNDHRLVTQMHVGTHIDAPLHMIDEGKRIDEIPVDSFVGNGVLIDANGKKEIGRDVLENVEIKPGDIALVCSGFGGKFEKKEYFPGSPFLTVDFANAIVARGVKMLGMDFSGPDIDDSWPVHKILLGNNILIIENLFNLEKLQGEEFEIIALPLNIVSDGSPARVIARIG